MKILGIEAATSVCAAAIVDDGSVLTEQRIEAQHSHSEKLVTLVDKCLQTVKCELKSLTGIAVSIGPGSFTGLRIGLSVAKGLSCASGVPLVSIPTLKALAWNAVTFNLVKPNDVVLPLIDARRDEVYMALYQWNGQKLEELVSSCAMSVKELNAQIPARHKVVILGDGAGKFQQFYKKAEIDDFSHYIIPEKDMRLCSAAAVAILGAEKLTMYGAENISSMEPLYVKDFFTLVKTQYQKVSI